MGKARALAVSEYLEDMIYQLNLGRTVGGSSDECRT